MVARANPACRRDGVGGGDIRHRSAAQTDGKRGHETEHSPAGAAVVSSVSASRCEATRAACRRFVRACRERWPERRRRRGAKGPAASVLSGVGVVATGAAVTGTDPSCRRARSSSRLVSHSL
jgi:hypothetical protein